MPDFDHNHFFMLKKDRALSGKVMEVDIKLSPPLEKPSRERIKRLIEIHNSVNLPTQPVKVSVYLNEPTKDLLLSDMPGIYLISDKFVEVLRDNDFSGWCTYPVQIIFDDGKELRGYHGFAISGRCGSTSYKEEFVKMYSRDRRKGLIFEPQSWDGSDIFTGEEQKLTKFVTTEVKQALESAGITNVGFTNITEAIEP